MSFAESRWKALLGGALVATGAGTAEGQFANQQTGGTTAVLRQGGGSGVFADTSLLNGPDMDIGGTGATEGSLVRDAAQAQENMFRSFKDGIICTPKLGFGSGNFSLSAPLGASAGFAPLVQAPRPDGLELKIGRFYLDLASAGLTFLYTDNSLLSQTGRKPEPTLSLRLQGSVIYQLNEAMQLSMAGSIFAEPLQKRITFSDPQAAYTGTFAPQFQTRFSYDIPFNHVDVVFLDQFTAQTEGVGESGQAFDLLSGKQQDQLLRDTQLQGATDRRRPTALAYRNIVGGNISSLLPTETRLTLGYTHENIWQTGSLGQTTSSDNYTALVKSERENLRFKPYYAYNARHQSGHAAFDHSQRGGVEGPITDYVDFRSEVGYFEAGDGAGEGYTWNVSLTHKPRERIEHQFEPDAVVSGAGYARRAFDF